MLIYSIVVTLALAYLLYRRYGDSKLIRLLKDKIDDLLSDEQ